MIILLNEILDLFEFVLYTRHSTASGESFKEVEANQAWTEAVMHRYSPWRRGVFM